MGPFIQLVPENPGGQLKGDICEHMFFFITYMLFAGWEVCIGKGCARDQGHSFSQYGPT